MDNSYYQKYLKYKNKYLALKEQEGKGLERQIRRENRQVRQVNRIDKQEMKLVHHEQVVNNITKHRMENKIVHEEHNQAVVAAIELHKDEKIIANQLAHSPEPKGKPIDETVKIMWEGELNSFFKHAGYNQSNDNAPVDLPLKDFASESNKEFGPVKVEGIKKIFYPEVTVEAIRKNSDKFLKWVLPAQHPLAENFINEWNKFTDGNIATQGIGFIQANLEYKSDNVHTATLNSKNFPKKNFLFTKYKIVVDNHPLVIISILIKSLENDEGYPFWPNNMDKDKHIYTPEIRSKITKSGVTVLDTYAPLLFPHFKPDVEHHPLEVQMYTNFDMGLYKRIEIGNLVTFIRVPM